MTTAFYAPPSAYRGRRVILPEEEARHAAGALRKQAGDEVIVVDGTGGWHRVRLGQVGRRRATGTVIETRREVGEPMCRLTIGLALLKSRNRFETFLEKAVELGVGRIAPLRTARTEKENFREERARKILIAAMKQCGRTRLPELTAPQLLEATLEMVEGHIVLCHEQAEAEKSLAAALDRGLPEALCLLVGPEGGFTEEEVGIARAAGAAVVSLGPRRLRSETAALAGAAAVMLAAD